MASWDIKGEKLGNIVSICPSCRAPVWLLATVQQTNPILNLKTIGIAPPEVTEKLMQEAIVQNRMLKSVIGMVDADTPKVIITEQDVPGTVTIETGRPIQWANLAPNLPTMPSGDVKTSTSNAQSK